MNKKIISLLTKAAAVVGLTAALAGISAGAYWQESPCMLGDLNDDGDITVADLIIMTRKLICNDTYDTFRDLSVEDAEDYFIDWEHELDSEDARQKDDIYVNRRDEFFYSPYRDTCDVVWDGRVDTFDLVMLRRMVIDPTQRARVYGWVKEKEPIPAPPTEFIDPPIYDLYGSMPSQGDAKIAAFYVDFPDCQFDYIPDTASIRDAMFGRQDYTDPAFPFESINAFYERSSKGALRVIGDVYTYTTQHSKSYYENDVWHVALVDEIIAAFDGQVDFANFDGDNDGTIDAILISVPTSAGDNDWWPAAGIFGGERFDRADGMNIGHVIVGNAEITNTSGGQRNFVSSYCHESGHCMGLPDYYLYTDPNDFQGMHGAAGFELMDDAICDLGAASKLMLGWYGEEQINVFDPADGAQEFMLYNAQTDIGNCVIIPRGDLGDKYRSEFFIVEYATNNGNNYGLYDEWWRAIGEGVRVYHVSAEVTGDPWYNSWKYASGNDEYTNYNRGRRFIRLVNESDDYSNNFFISPEVIDSSISDFRWYDKSGGLTVETGITIEIEEYVDETGYKIRISAA